MDNRWLQLLGGIAFLILYLFFSAKTEMGTKLFMNQNSDRLAEIINFLQISDKLATAGQPTIKQFRSIADAGYETVINLALPTSDGAIANEAQLVQSFGMEYIAIPVNWESPTMADLDGFLQAMEQRQRQKIFVHCAKNMRVSAFVYLYRRLHLNCDREQAIADLHKIWQPNETWQKFIDAKLT
ncbi:protein tyrosine phosphatase family protein [Pseudanabaena sp. BC1403]|uniref:protein tyrosine phosphatase family protein n=1 Tax=Pseudanabaena sp. BC1403 TaxID=2043171 RepID=UPI0021563E72|nr:protein tyrosine phosphatase family protein [Pseudanabaena sp. BC1403]